MRLSCLFMGLALLAAPAMGGEAGRELFDNACSGCHQLGGIGSPGLAPPLVDAELWNGLGDRAGTYISGILVSGFSGRIVAKGETYVGLAMPPQDWLTDEEMAAVADYVLNDLNGLGAAPTPELFAAARSAPPSHKQLKTLRQEVLP